MADSRTDSDATLAGMCGPRSDERRQASGLVRIGLASWSIIGIAAVLVVSLAVLAGDQRDRGPGVTLAPSSRWSSSP